MKRRSFLQFLGLAPAAAVAAPKALETMAEKAAALEPKVDEPEVPVYETQRGEADTGCTMSCAMTCGTMAYMQPVRRR